MDDQYYNDYFERLAIRSNDIDHKPDAVRKSFFVINDMENLREIEDAIRQSMESHALLIENFEDEVTDNDSDNNQERIDGAFAVIIRTGREKSIRDTVRQARNIARKLVFRMMWDARNGELQDKGIVVKLASKGFPVGPVADGCYGWRYTFTWTASLITALDPGDFKP